MEIPPKDPAIIKRDNIPSGLMDTRMPIDTPMVNDINMAVKASSKVAGNRSRMVSSALTWET